MKRISALLALSLLATAASASTLYTMTSVRYDNSFASAYFVGPAAPPGYTNFLNGVCSGCGVSTAVDDGLGNITVTGAAWSVNTTTGSPTNYTTSFDATTTLGANTVQRTSLSCVDTVGTTCSANRAGLGIGDWKATGLAQDGTTACNLNGVICNTQVYTYGGSLFLVKTMALNENPNGTFFQRYTLQYNQVVPVPGAVWLLGSAVGLLGLARRRARA